MVAILKQKAIELQTIKNNKKKIVPIEFEEVILPAAPIEHFKLDNEAKLPLINDLDNYESVKLKLKGLLSRMRRQNYICIYDPVQKRKLADQVDRLIEKLDSLKTYLPGTLFGKTIAKRPLRDDASKATMLKYIFNVIVDPTGEKDIFTRYVQDLIATYPQGDAGWLYIRGHLEALVGGIGCFVSYVAGLMTAGLGLVGIIPSAPLLVHGMKTIEDSKLAGERRKVEHISDVISTFYSDEEYHKVKRRLFQRMGLVKVDPTVHPDIKVLPPKSYFEQIEYLVSRLDKTNLPDSQKKEILLKVEEVIQDTSKVDSFADYIHQVKQTHPSDTVETCQFKAIASATAAAFLYIFSVALAGVSCCASLIGFLPATVLAKYSNKQFKKLNLAFAEETLDEIHDGIKKGTAPRV